MPAEQTTTSNGRGGWVLAGVGLLLLTLGLALPFLLQRHLAVAVDVLVERVEIEASAETPLSIRLRLNDGFFGIFTAIPELVQETVETQQLIVHVKVENKTLLPVRVRSASYAVQLDGEPVASGEWLATEELWLTSSEHALPLELGPEVDPALLLTLARAVGRGRAPTVWVGGEVTVSLLGNDFVLPFEVERIAVDLRALDLSLLSDARRPDKNRE